MTTSLGKRQSIDLHLLTAGHFAANLNLPTGQARLTINATPAQGPPTTPAARPSSTAKLTILSPRNGQPISRQTPEVHLGLAAARIVSQTTTRIRPTRAHRRQAR